DPKADPKADPKNSGLCFLDCSRTESLGNAELSEVLRRIVGQKVLCLLGRGGSPNPSVQPGDIAILMGRRQDCIQMYQHLQNLGIPAQYNEKKSIFSDRNAMSLYHFFLALCEPRQLEHSARLFLSPLFALHPEEVGSLFRLSHQVSARTPVGGGEFALSFTRQLFAWQEQVERGFLLDVLQELCHYGPKIYQALELLHGAARAELRSDVYSRLLGHPRDGRTHIASCAGERQDSTGSYYKLRHLLEILSAEQLRRGIGCHELSRFMAQQIQQARKTEPRKEYLQRGTESQAVNIMTIHASKGLEFPVVFVVMGLSEGVRDSLVLKTDLQGQEIRQTAFLDGGDRELADQEVYAELQRLFYVALTRASDKIYLPFHPLCKKPIPYLKLLEDSLGQGRGGDLRAAVDGLVQEQGAYFSREPEENFSDASEFEPARAQAQSREDRGCGAVLRELQNGNLAQRFPVVSSFTSLQREVHEKSKGTIQGKARETYPADERADSDSLDKDRDDLASGTSVFASLEEPVWAFAWPEEQRSGHELWLSPGADLGNLLHHLLENLDYRMIAESSLDELYHCPHFFEQLSRQSRRYFPRTWIRSAYPALCRMIWHTLHCDLMAAQISPGPRGSARSELGVEGAKPLRLCQLSEAQRRHELEFLFSVPQDCSVDKRLFLPQSGCQQSSQEGSSQEGLVAGGKIEISISQGFLKGFIDLLFLHEGKLYLLDWKSNLSHDAPPETGQISGLGEPLLRELQRQLYRPEALRQLMSKHHYEMQYLLYLAVVYGYLKSRYGSNFHYNRDFGGCYYLFLRGMGADNSGIFFHKPEEEHLAQILRALGISRK
ncbi:MAG: 3'-5' exonuclease, partial [Spirochaetota bacterium]